MTPASYDLINYFCSPEQIGVVTQEVNDDKNMKNEITAPEQQEIQAKLKLAQIVSEKLEQSTQDISSIGPTISGETSWSLVILKSGGFYISTFPPFIAQAGKKTLSVRHSMQSSIHILKYASDWLAEWNWSSFDCDNSSDTVPT